MRWQLLTSLVVGLALTAAEPRVDPIRDDNFRLEGIWSLVSLEVEGQTADVSKLTEARLIIEGNRYSFQFGATHLEMVHQVAQGKRPKELDMTITEGPMNGKTFHAIYELSDDTLRICRNVDPDRERPTAFASTPGSRLMLIVWRRNP